MKTSKLTIIFAFLMACINLQAQDGEKKNSLSLGWGIGHLKIQDQVFSPTIHSGTSPVNAIVSYNHSDKLEHLLYVKFGNYKSSVYDPFSYYWDTPDETQMTWASSFTRLEVNYSLGKSIVQKEDFTMVLGGRSRNRLQPSGNARGAYQIFGYYLSFGIDVWTQFSYMINDRHELKADMAIPLFSFNARSPYMSQDDWFFENTYSHKALVTLREYIKDGKLESWGKAQSLDISLKYAYSLNEKWTIGAGYWFALNMNQSTRDITSVENLLSLNLTLKF